MDKPRKPKFRVGEVVSVNSFYGNFQHGQTGPGYKGRSGWRHGWQFGKIVKINLPSPTMKWMPCYFLDGWYSAMPEKYLRPITKRESNT